MECVKQITKYCSVLAFKPHSHYRVGKVQLSAIRIKKVLIQQALLYRNHIG